MLGILFMVKRNNEMILGTRGSELALEQAKLTQALLNQSHADLIVTQSIIKTTGDRRTDVALSQVAKSEQIIDKGIFIKELEDALDRREIDIAVHSLKDLPTILDERFELAAVLERAAVRDVLLTLSGGGVSDLKTGARVGTSSVRRARQLLFLRPDLQIIDLRGNVPTRIQKLALDQDYDAIVLAEAGLLRLGLLDSEGDVLRGYDQVQVHRLHQSEFYPAAGQGAIGIEIRRGDEEARQILKSLNHEPTWKCVTAEREFLRLLGAGCHTPVGVYSDLDGEMIDLKAWVFSEQDLLAAPKIAAARANDAMDAAKKLYLSL